MLMSVHCCHQVFSLWVPVAQLPPSPQRNSIPSGLAPPCGDITENSVTSSCLHSTKEPEYHEKLLPLPGELRGWDQKSD